ncbi:MAG: thioredoxin family protein [Candidatus Firestonebacteria bacterium]
MKKQILFLLLTVILAPAVIAMSKKAPEAPAAAAENTVKPKVTFVELGSKSCIPCKMMQKVMDEVEKEYGSKIKIIFYDVWTEEGKPFAEKYKISLIPTQVFLDENGKEYFRHEGFFPKEEVDKILKQGGAQK